MKKLELKIPPFALTLLVGFAMVVSSLNLKRFGYISAYNRIRTICLNGFRRDLHFFGAGFDVSGFSGGDGGSD